MVKNYVKKNDHRVSNKCKWKAGDLDAIQKNYSGTLKRYVTTSHSD